MKEMDVKEFIHKILLEGCDNIVPDNIEQSLICAVLDALYLPNYSRYKEDKRAKIESAIINNIRPAIVQFEHLQQLYETYMKGIRQR